MLLRRPASIEDSFSFNTGRHRCVIEVKNRLIGAIATASGYDRGGSVSGSLVPHPLELHAASVREHFAQ